MTLISIIVYNLLIFLPVKSDEQFNFDVTEIEIKEKGNIIEGNKKGLVTTNDGIYVYADYFKYNKSLNILNARGNVKIIDKVKNFTFFSNEIVYLKDKEIIFSNTSSKAISDNLSITSDKFKYNKFSNVLYTKGNVKLIDTEKEQSFYLMNLIISKMKIKYFLWLYK